MGGVDEKVDAVFLEMGGKTLDAAEAADADRHACGTGFSRAAGERQRDVVLRGEFSGKLAGFGGAAEDEDLFHGALFDIAPHPYPLPVKTGRGGRQRCGHLSSPRPYGERMPAGR